MMKVLVVGNGGREHALTWKLAQSPSVQTVYAVPGNAGTYREPKVENVVIDPLDFSALAEFATKQQIDFTVVGPEMPLVAGIVDYFAEKQLLCLGPTKAAAQLEGSKVFAKSFMQRHRIPTAKAEVFTEAARAQAYLSQATFPIVIKADGLAAGKGVVIAENKAEAENIIDAMLAFHRFGAAGDQIVLEEYLYGEEVSFIALCDGTHCVPFATSQDHKRRDEGDKGPNTGGMGAYSPADFAPDLQKRVMQEVMEPALAGMAQEGTPFQGFLYAGLMITPQDQIKVLEFNCRFGDPEAQPILMRLQSDFAELCLAALHGKLADHPPLQWDPRAALGVVLTAPGYPEHYQTGEVIPTLNDIPASDQYKIFHAGTKLEDGRIVTQGGRLLCVTALGNTLEEAQEKAYRLVKKVKWEGTFYRNDIGHRGLKVT